MAANFIRSILGRFEHFRSKSLAHDQSNPNHFRDSPKAEDIAFHEVRLPRPRTSGLISRLAKYLVLPLAGIAVIAIGVACGNHSSKVDWPTVVKALKGQVEQVSSKQDKPNPAPLQIQSVAETPVALRLPMPTPFNQISVPIPLGIPLPVIGEAQSPVGKVKADVAVAVTAIDVTLRSSPRASSEAVDILAQDDNSVYFRTKEKAIKTTAAKPETLKLRAVAIVGNDLIVQTISPDGRVIQAKLTKGDKLADGQTLLGLDAATGSYTTDRGGHSLWEPGQ